jgi:hypothetical protein
MGCTGGTESAGAHMITDNQKRAMIAAKVTLDGKPALIMGRLEAFPIVASLDGKHRAEFSWRTCAAVLASGGNFKT